MAVTTTTIETALGRPHESATPEEQAQWSMWVSDALLLIEERLGDPSALDQAKLDYVVREAVVAHIRNPDDATQVSVTLGEASESKTYRSGTGRVTIRDEWWAMLTEDVDDAGAFTIDTVSNSTTHLSWCAYVLGAAYCSCGAVLAGYPLYEL